MRAVYICSPLSGNMKKNLENVKEYCHCIINQYDGKVIPIAPHLYFTQFLDDTNKVEREQGIQCGLALLNTCDELWVIGTHVSDGMAREISDAAKLCKTIKWFEHRVDDVCSDGGPCTQTSYLIERNSSNGTTETTGE